MQCNCNDFAGVVTVTNITSFSDSIQNYDSHLLKKSLHVFFYICIVNIAVYWYVVGYLYRI